MKQLLYPMFALILLTYVVLFRNVIARIASIKADPKSAKYYRIFAGEAPNETILKLKNHLTNLFEFPLFFFSGCLAAMALNIQDEVLLDVAWAYVGMRLAHTVIHTTSNRQPHRLISFATSNILLGVFWIRLLVAAG